VFKNDSLNTTLCYWGKTNTTAFSNQISRKFLLKQGNLMFMSSCLSQN